MVSKEYRLPIVRVKAFDRDGNIIYQEEDGEKRLPEMYQKDDCNLYQMVYEVMVTQVGYYPLEIGEYDVDTEGEQAVITFQCSNCIEIDERKTIEGDIDKLKVS